MGRLVSKDGVPMVATVERVPGTCGICDVTRNADGSFEVEYDGNGTDVNWDGQETVERDGQTVYEGEDGLEYLEGDLIYEEDE